MRYGALLAALGWPVFAAACHPPCEDGTHERDGVCVASLSPACGPGTDLQAGYCVPGGGGASCGPGTHDEAGTCRPDVPDAGNSGRLNGGLMLAPPSLATLGSAALSEALRNGNALFFVAFHDPTGLAGRLHGGGADREGAVYRSAAERAFDAAAVATSSGLATAAPFRVPFPAIGTSNLLLEDVVLSEVVVAADGGLALPRSGRLAGVITPAHAEELYIDLAGQTLRSLLESLGEPADVDRDGDGTAESWSLVITFTTEPAWLL